MFLGNLGRSEGRRGRRGGGVGGPRPRAGSRPAVFALPGWGRPRLPAPGPAIGGGRGRHGGWAGIAAAATAAAAAPANCCPGPQRSAAPAAPTSRCRCCPSGRPRAPPNRSAPAWRALPSAGTGSEAGSLPRPDCRLLRGVAALFLLPAKRLGRCSQKRIPCRSAACCGIPRPLARACSARGAPGHRCCRALHGAVGVLR